MPTEEISNNKRIAKNTLLLYGRTIVTMVISLYTSRVLLEALGVDNYGIYSVVGGAVSMFSLISASISSAISRFITFELGKGDLKKLNRIFSTSLNIQLCISAIVIVLGVTVGNWFVSTHLNIDTERLDAAQWVLYCSLLTFCANLISLPYNACIIAHEKMSAFAHIGILDAALKLLICYLVATSPFDGLKTYASLLVIIAITIRLIYGIYCKRHFEECKYKLAWDTALIKEMSGFASWTMLTNGCLILNNQGINILTNLYFGVILNAARGIATQVDGAILQFVNNFTTALNPQIIKMHAAEEKEAMFKLVCRGAKFSFFLLLILALPVLVETEYILSIWLPSVPEYTSAFVRLGIVASFVNTLGNSSYVACMATGRVRRYAICISSTSLLAFPITLICFEAGLPPTSSYITYIFVYIAVTAVRLWVMKDLLQFEPTVFIKEVIAKVCLVSAIAVILPLCIVHNFDSSTLRFCSSALVSIFSSGLCIFFLGLEVSERNAILGQIITKIKSFKAI